MLAGEDIMRRRLIRISFPHQANMCQCLPMFESKLKTGMLALTLITDTRDGEKKF